jgi:AcrR family transcriptional regulator
VFTITARGVILDAVPKSTRVSPDERLEDDEKVLLETAAEMIVEAGTREIDISKLATRAGIRRPTIYARYRTGQKQSPGNILYLRILNEFLKDAGASIRGARASVDQTADARPTPGEELAAILRATLTAFNQNQLFGKVVLQELRVRNPEENKLIRPIFDEVDKIIELARGSKHLNETQKDDWKIRQILFVVTRGLLRTLYLDQYDRSGKLLEKSKLTQREIEVEILRVLSLYFQQESETKVKQTIEVLHKRKENISAQ